jgi:hypothetical protein
MMKPAQPPSDRRADEAVELPRTLPPPTRGRRRHLNALWSRAPGMRRGSHAPPPSPSTVFA